MPIPDLSQGAGSLIREGQYILANVKADPETAADAALLAGPQATLSAAVVARRDADTAAIEAAAVATRRLSAAQRAIIAFGVKAFGHYGSRTDPGYLALFPMAPSALANSAGADRAVRFAALRKATQVDALPQELRAAAAAVHTALGAFDAAGLADGAAAAAFKAAFAQEKQATDAWQTAVRTLRGRLIMLFPRDAKRVASYFPQARARAKAAKPVVAPPA